MAPLALCILCAFVLPDLASSTKGTKTKTTTTRTTTTSATPSPSSSLSRAAKTTSKTTKTVTTTTMKAAETTASVSTTSNLASSCSSATTSTPGLSTASGECVGNDSRCSGSSQMKCKSLGREGTDCQWEAHIGVQSIGKCSGNDSRCTASRQATCNRLSTQGSDCRWESSMWASGPSGRCLGNDSRCGGSLEAGCKSLAKEGADCKWRGAFSVSGSVKLVVSNVESFVKSCEAKVAVGQGIANLTGVPAEYVDIDFSPEFEQRRLRAQELGKAVALTVTYAISVDGAAPASVTRTATEVARDLMAANADVIRSTISASVHKAMGSDSALFIVGVKEVKEPNVVLKSPSQMSTSTTKISAKQTTGSTMRTLMLSSTTPTTTGTTTSLSTTTSTPAALLETSGSRKLSGSCMCFLTSLCMMIAFPPL